MEKQFVTYEIALNLKKLGFDEECFGYYVNMDREFRLIEGYLFSNKTYTGSEDFLTTAPLWQQAIDFLLEKYNLHIEFGVAHPLSYSVAIYSIDKRCYIVHSLYYDFIRDAKEQIILKAIEIIKNEYNKKNV